MFEKILIEKELAGTPMLESMLKRLRVDGRDVDWIDRAEDIFNRVKKPYLQKRQGQQLFIAKKRGALIKKAPVAYGTKGEEHFYFIHAYNCIYECSYCYLQGHFHSPDLVMFINHHEILSEMEGPCGQATAQKPVWFHAGEFSDSLALSHLSGELPLYFDHFKKYPHSRLELRTKSVNLRALEECTPLKNVVISYSLAPWEHCQEFDLKAPPLNLRLKAMQKLEMLSHPLGLHFDPIIATPGLFEKYQVLLTQIKEHIDLGRIEYLSLGVVRFTKSVWREVEKNYPEHDFVTQDMIRASDGKIRYPRPLRMHFMREIKKLAVNAGVPEDRIYLCMEDG